MRTILNCTILVVFCLVLYATRPSAHPSTARSGDQSSSNTPAQPAPTPVTCTDTSGQHLNWNAGTYTCGISTAFSSPLFGTSTTQSPGLLVAGACNNFTISVTSATTAQTVSGISAIGGVDIGVGVTLTAAVTSAGTVTVHECALVSATPVGAQFRVVVQ